MRRPLSLLTVVLSIITASSQDIITPVRSDMVPPAPSSRAIVEAQIPRPSVLTGAVQFEIPVYTISFDSFSLPVFLQYRSNGVKVLDEPAPLGLGWTLSPALRATRTVMGRPDELYPARHSTGGEDVSHDAYECMVKDIGTITGSDGSVCHDSQHDIITFCLPDRVLTRVIDTSSGETCFIGASDDEYKVRSDSLLNVIEVRAPDGTSYIFGSPYEESPNESDRHPSWRTGWAMTRIISNSGRAIELQWEKGPFHYKDIHWIGGSSYLDERSPSLLTGTDDEYENSSFAAGIITYSNSRIPIIRLKSMSFPGGDITFTYSSPENKFISQIKVSDGLTNVKTTNLTYETRLGDNVVLKSVDNGDGSPYAFTYSEEEMECPHALDWWGFHNGKHNYSLDIDVFFRISHGPSEGYYRVGSVLADRSVDEEAMKSCILTGITYPTGAVASFEYEAHTFDPMRMDSQGNIKEGYDPYLSHGGGLRVKKISLRNGNDDNTPREVTYTYSKATVRAVPSAATFFNVHTAVLPAPPNTAADQITSVRLVNILPFSDYMRYDFGETEIWYPEVTETYAEGKTVYNFQDINPNHNFFDTGFGRHAIRSLRRVFSKGPQLVRTTTYRREGTGYEKVSCEKKEYELVSGGSSPYSTFIERTIVQSGNLYAVEPDFDKGHEMVGRDGTIFDIRSLGQPYECSVYFIFRETERQKAYETIEYVGTDSMVIRKEMTYVSSSGLPLKTITHCGDEHVSVDITYPDASCGGVEGNMAAAGLSGVPVRATITNSSGIVSTIEAHYAEQNGIFRKRRITTVYAGSTDTITSPFYTYTAPGNLGGMTDADGISTAFAWGHGHTVPVYKAEGTDYAGLCNGMPSALTGNANNATSINVGNALLTRAEYKPLVGVSAFTWPWGKKETFTYDLLGRLTGANISGIGPMVTYEYRTNHDGDNRVIENRRTCSSSTSRTVTAFYDACGRLTERRDMGGGASTIPSSPGATVSVGTSSVFTDYDAMGRVARVSVPSASRPASAHLWTDYSYEKSPRKILEKETKPGQAWKSSDKGLETRILLNGTAMPLNCPRLKDDGNGGVIHAGVLPSGMATVRQTTDEDGHVIYEFTDWRGRMLCRREGSGSDWFSTYYIYDNRDRLVRILSPMNSVRTYAPDDSALDDYSFAYGYDVRDRLVWSRVPGCAPEKTVYSPAGRVAAQHSPSMADAEWMLTYYDSYGREAAKAIATMVTEALDRVSTRPPVIGLRNGNGLPRYDLPAADSIKKVVNETYYDSYSFSPSTIGLGFVADPETATTYNNSPKGLPTGGMERGDDGTARYHAVYYDSHGRLVQSASNTAAGVLRVCTGYTYDGQVNLEKVTLTLPQGAKQTLVSRYSYDSAGRPNAMTVTLNGKTATRRMAYNAMGLVSQECLGGSITRAYSYDEHGWPTETVTSVPLTVVNPNDPSGPLQTSFYGSVDPNGSNASGIGSGAIVNDLKYNEQIYYATGKYPRYSGEMSARKLTSGDRYDYRFDSHHRLIAAEFSGFGGGDEDFSTSYTYDAIGRPLTVMRYGVTGVTGGEEVFGELDRLTYSYSGALLSSVSQAAESSGVSYAATGFGPSGTASYCYDSAGKLVSDGRRKVSAINYNHLGLPVRTEITVSSGTRGTRYVEERAYMPTGAISEVRYLHIRGFAETGLGGWRQAGPFRLGHMPFGNDTLSRVEFGGGYFDGDGSVRWTLTDALGSVNLVADSTGTVLQHNRYYPYGEPWREPSGQPRLFGGKERRRFQGLNDYDFGPRYLDSPTALWSAPDKRAHSYPWLSPWSFCAANPVRYVDPSGEDIAILLADMHLGILIQNENKKWEYFSLNGVNYYESTNGEIGGNNHHNLGEISFDSTQAFLESSFNTKGSKDEKERDITSGYHYKEALILPTTQKQDMDAAAKFREAAQDGYDLMRNNCADAVQRAASVAYDIPKIPISLYKGTFNYFKPGTKNINTTSIILLNGLIKTLNYMNEKAVSVPSIIFDNYKQKYEK